MIRLIAAVISILACLLVANDTRAACQLTDAIYLSNDGRWALSLPLNGSTRDMGERASVPMVTLHSRDKNKTYDFGWTISNNIVVERLVPLWLPSDKGRGLRVYHYKTDQLINGLPSAEESAPEGIFIEDIDLFFFYDVDPFEDQDWLSPGIWKLSACLGDQAPMRQ